MASNSHHDLRNPSTPPQSIPLQDLARPPDNGDVGDGEQGNTRGRSLINGATRPNSSTNYGTRYERLEDISPSPTERISLHNDLAQPPQIHESLDEEVGSPIENPAAFQAAVGFGGFAGLEMGTSGARRPSLPGTRDSGLTDTDAISPYGHPYQDSDNTYFHQIESDQTPLTDPNYLQPMSGANVPSSSQSQDRSSFQSVRFNTPDSKTRSSRLGDDLPGLDTQYGNTRPRGRSFGESLSPGGRRGSRSPSIIESPLSRAGSIVRAMSQRVVNLGNEPEPPEFVRRRQASMSEEPPQDLDPSLHMATEDTFYPPERLSIPVEKEPPGIVEEPKPPLKAPWPATNPFKGKSLGIISPDNPIRVWLCDFLVHPVTEIAILVLIILQTVLLAVESSADVFTNPRSQRWGDTYIDYAILALFVIFTIEIIIRIIVSGFFFNAAEYSTIDKQKGVKAAVVTKYRTYFAPQRKASIKRPQEADANAFSASFARSLTVIQGSSATEPTSAEEFQRLQLARRAFLRHSWNRIDFVAVVSFWITFALSTTGIESARHMYVFRMLSCLRILRLLYLTNGTSVSKIDHPCVVHLINMYR